MSDCHTARNGAGKVQNLQRALYRKSKQEKEARFYSLYDKVWRTEVLWEAWRQVKANQGAPGVDGKAIDEIVASGQEEAMIEKLQAALRAPRYQFAPVRVVEIPKPKGGTRPLGIAMAASYCTSFSRCWGFGPCCDAGRLLCPLPQSLLGLGVDGNEPRGAALRCRFARLDVVPIDPVVHDMAADPELLGDFQHGQFLGAFQIGGWDGMLVADPPNPGHGKRVPFVRLQPFLVQALHNLFVGQFLGECSYAFHELGRVAPLLKHLRGERHGQIF